MEFSHKEVRLAEISRATASASIFVYSSKMYGETMNGNKLSENLLYINLLSTFLEHIFFSFKQNLDATHSSYLFFFFL